ncbi:MAG: inorganic phosphate transporter [Planctomycetes bacterium]|nr:inorganic phosphate transporter [Planctomycetota bacterium]
MNIELLGQVGDAISHPAWITGLAIAFGVFMAWSIGANDVANAMGTSVGSKSLTLMQAIIIASVLEFAGALLIGRHVSDKIRQDIFVPGAFDGIVHLYAYGMLASLLSAAVWMMAATYFGLPVSTTHSIVGAVIGFGLVTLKLDQIIWGEVGKIVLSWIVSPLLAGVVSYAIFRAIQRQILFQRDMVKNAKRMAPILMFLVFLTVFLVTLYKGLKPVLKPLGLEDLGFWQALLCASPISILATLACMPLVRRVRIESSILTHGRNPVFVDEVTMIIERIKKLAHIADETTKSALQLIQDKLQTVEERLLAAKVQAGDWGTPEMKATERIFVYLQILSACALAFAHGANDVANSVGPLAGVILVAKDGVEGLKVSINNAGAWGVFILVIGGTGIVLGLATWGWRVIETIGKKITELTPTRGFAAQFGAALTILIASRHGLPISTTHTLVGAVLGVGLARGMGALNFRVIRDIVISWIVTLPLGAILTIVFFVLFRWIFGG